MAKAVLYHKPDSQYDDRPDSFYHFPKQYLTRVEQTIGDQIIYYGPLGKFGPCYQATATVARVREDDARSGHYYADVDGFIDFDRPVPYRENGGFERKLVLPDGTTSAGRAVQAVRLIKSSEFVAIIEAGLSSPENWSDDVNDYENEGNAGFSEELQTEFKRPVVQQLLNRPFRDAKFRQHVRRAYDRTCAFTGLRLINGKGRPEVQAAHIKPVEAGGSDSVRNGIALSGTVHWMFDRGLLSLDDDFTILKSRHLNYDISHILLSDMRALVPNDEKHQPHPYFLDWHRTNRFKS